MSNRTSDGVGQLRTCVQDFARLAAVRRETFRNWVRQAQATGPLGGIGPPPRPPAWRSSNITRYNTRRRNFTLDYLSPTLFAA